MQTCLLISLILFHLRGYIPFISNAAIKSCYLNGNSIHQKIPISILYSVRYNNPTALKASNIGIGKLFKKSVSILRAIYDYITKILYYLTRKPNNDQNIVSNTKPFTVPSSRKYRESTEISSTSNFSPETLEIKPIRDVNKPIIGTNQTTLKSKDLMYAENKLKEIKTLEDKFKQNNSSAMQLKSDKSKKFWPPLSIQKDNSKVKKPFPSSTNALIAVVEKGVKDVVDTATLDMKEDVVVTIPPQESSIMEPFVSKSSFPTLPKVYQRQDYFGKWNLSEQRYANYYKLLAAATKSNVYSTVFLPFNATEQDIDRSTNLFIKESLWDTVSIPEYGSVQSLTHGTNDENGTIELKINRGCSHTQWLRDKLGQTSVSITRPPKVPYDQLPTTCIYRGMPLGNRIIGYVYVEINPTIQLFNGSVASHHVNELNEILQVNDSLMEPIEKDREIIIGIFQMQRLNIK